MWVQFSGGPRDEARDPERLRGPSILLVRTSIIRTYFKVGGRCTCSFPSRNRAPFFIMSKEKTFLDQIMNQEIGLRIKSARRAQGVSQEHLAEVIGRSVSTVQRIEKNSSGKYEDIYRICQYLNLPM